jgi:single-strand DNA-binding protein
VNNIDITFAGNLTADPELRFTPSGKAVTSFQVAHTDRRRNGNGWQDGTTTFLRCEAWNDMAENVAESLAKGARVVVTGRLTTERFQRSNGEPGWANKVVVDEVGVSLRWATATPVRTGRRDTELAQDQPADGETTEHRDAAPAEVPETGGYSTTSTEDAATTETSTDSAPRRRGRK